MTPKSPSPFITSFFFFLYFVTSIFADGKQHRFHEPLSKASFGLKTEKFSHFRFYWHDIVSGSRPTAMKVAGTLTNTSASGFGLIYMIDDPLTEGPTMKSKLVGRAQGFYALASQQGINLLMAMNFAFIEGKYNGSTITILGRNSVLSTLREMPVIGGSGLFRFARGYALVSTHQFNAKSMDAIVEYNVFDSLSYIID